MEVRSNALVSWAMAELGRAASAPPIGAALLLEPWTAEEDCCAADRVRSYAHCCRWLCMGVRRLRSCGRVAVPIVGAGP